MITELPLLRGDADMRRLAPILATLALVLCSCGDQAPKVVQDRQGDWYADAPAGFKISDMPEFCLRLREVWPDQTAKVVAVRIPGQLKPSGCLGPGVDPGEVQ